MVSLSNHERIGWIRGRPANPPPLVVLCSRPGPALCRPISPPPGQQYAMLIDLHNHTYPKSDDSFMSADELVDAAKSAGLDGLCITEHDEFWPYDEASRLSRRHGILVLPGSEINTDAGHVLAFGLTRYRFGMHKPSFLRAEADSLGGVLIAAHPYRRRFLKEPGADPVVRAEMLQRAVSDPHFQLFDAIESLNGRGLPPENLFSEDLRSRLALPGVAGSDAHRTNQIATVATQFQRRIATLADLIQEIRAGRVAPVNLTAAVPAAAPPAPVA